MSHDELYARLLFESIEHFAAHRRIIRHIISSEKILPYQPAMILYILFRIQPCISLGGALVSALRIQPLLAIESFSGILPLAIRQKS